MPLTLNTCIMVFGRTWGIFISNRALGNIQKYIIGDAELVRCSLNWKSVIQGIYSRSEVNWHYVCLYFGVV